MHTFILVILITSFIIEFTIGPALKGKKLLSLGVFSFFIGIAIFILNRFFGVPIYSLRYGVMPEIANEQYAEDAALVVIWFGLFLIVLAKMIDCFSQKK
ncbi:MAG: hypothetical protein AB8D52_06720 [Gammaproteobacteria bacterium]